VRLNRSEEIKFCEEKNTIFFCYGGLIGPVWISLFYSLCK